METETTHGTPAFTSEPGKEHQWLRKLVGDWVYETPAPAEPGQPAGTLTGTEHVRFLGDIWFVAEGEGELPDGAIGRTLMTLGYDPQKQRFVGTWLGTMMHHLWVYEGELDDTGKLLTLDSVGPDFEAPGKTRRYQDVIEVEDDDHRLLIGRMLGDDGEWREIMRARYRRASTGQRGHDH